MLPPSPPAARAYVERDMAFCNVWLNAVALALGLGFSTSELRELERIFSRKRALLLNPWEKFKSNQGKRVTDIATTEFSLIVNPANVI